MHRSRLITGLAAVFTGLAAVLAALGVAYNPGILLVAALFGIVAYIFYRHGTGKLVARIYRRVERRAASNTARSNRTSRGGFGAGPRESRTGPYQRRGRGTRRRNRRVRGNGDRTNTTPTEAYDVLGLDRDATESDVRQAYRERVKETHPDTEGGDEETFKRVTDAYEILTE